MAVFASPFKRQLADNKQECGSYLALVTGAALVWGLVSSGEFSFAMTLGSITSMFSFAMLAVCLRKTAQGISLRMLEVYAILQFFKCWAVLPYEGYLPFDASGDWFYQCCEVGRGRGIIGCGFDAVGEERGVCR